MKLIDLLVKELPKLGGWPDGAEYARVSHFGVGKILVDFRFPDAYGELSYCIGVIARNLIDTGTDVDYHMIRRDSYESALSASKKPTWNGEGLPPVGIKCEHCHGGTTQHEWEVVTVAGVHKNASTGFTDYWLVRENGSSYIVGNPYRFRPLRTEAEKALESAKHIIAELCRDSASNGHSADLIMEAITAGKIPGVKLDD